MYIFRAACRFRAFYAKHCLVVLGGICYRLSGIGRPHEVRKARGATFPFDHVS